MPDGTILSYADDTYDDDEYLVNKTKYELFVLAKLNLCLYIMHYLIV